MGKHIKPRIRKRKSRRRIGARTYKNYTEDMLNLAIQLVRDKTLSSRDAERQFNIPPRSILNKINKTHEKPVGFSLI